MKTGKIFVKSFNYRMLLTRILVTMLSLLITALLVPKIMLINRSFSSWVLLAIGLGVITALVKPIIQFLTLRFIFATGGLVLVIVNGLLLYLLAWLMPDYFTVTSLFWAMVGGLVLGVSSTILEYLFGLTPPIVSEKYPEIRQRVKDRQFYRMQNELSRIGVVKKGSAGQLAAAKVMVVDANPAVAKLLTKDSQAAEASIPTDDHAGYDRVVPSSGQAVEDIGAAAEDSVNAAGLEAGQEA
jgi:putative membrane protein